MNRDMKTIGWLISSGGFTGPELARRKAHLAKHLRPDFDVDVIIPAGSPAFLDSSDALGVSDAALTGFLASEEAERCDVFVLAGAIDPGLKLARSTARRPVVGPFESTVLFSKVWGHRIGVLSSDALIAGATEALVDSLGAAEHVAGVHAIDFPVRDIVTKIAAGDATVQQEVQQRLVERAREAKAAGATAIYFGSMTLGTVGAADRIRDEIGIPVIDPAAIALAVAMDAADLRGGRA